MSPYKGADLYTAKGSVVETAQKALLVSNKSYCYFSGLWSPIIVYSWQAPSSLCASLVGCDMVSRGNPSEPMVGATPPAPRYFTLFLILLLLLLLLFFAQMAVDLARIVAEAKAKAKAKALQAAQAAAAASRPPLPIPSTPAASVDRSTNTNGASAAATAAATAAAVAAATARVQALAGGGGAGLGAGGGVVAPVVAAPSSGKAVEVWWNRVGGGNKSSKCASCMVFD